MRMESPGEYLKREREQRGVSLADIFKATRVPLKHLEALEADNFDSMPHPTFIKGYIRSYCKVLGVDETDAVLRYEVYLRDKADREHEPRPQARIPQPKDMEKPPLLGQFWEDKRNVIMVAVAAAVVVVIIIVAAFFMFGSGGPEPVPTPSEEQAAPEPAEAAPEPVKEAKPVKPAAAAKVREKAPEPVKAAEKEPAQMRHALIVRANDTVWIEATIDGAEPFDVTLKDEETVIWKAADTISLKVGNAGGVALTFDGKPLAPLGEPGYVVSISLPGGKVKVLAKPKPEVEPAPKPAPVESVKEPEPAPGVSIKELMPVLPPVEGAKTPAPAVAPVEGVKSTEPAPGVSIKELVPALAPDGDEVSPTPEAAPKEGVKSTEPGEGATDVEEPADVPPAP